MKEITLKVNDFEGPLDLLLHLISKNKMDIVDIDIIKIVEYYIFVINENKKFNIEIASEFIIMASRLLYLKSIILIPKKDEIEELKKEIVGQLIEYKLCKEIAETLSGNSSGLKRMIREEVEIGIEEDYDCQHNSIELLKAYYQMLDTAKKKLPPNEKEFDMIVQRTYVSVESRVFYVLKNLRKLKNISLFNIFNSDDKSSNVATFLAVLELIKSNRIVISEDCQYISLKESA